MAKFGKFLTVFAFLVTSLFGIVAVAQPPQGEAVSETKDRENTEANSDDRQSVNPEAASKTENNPTLESTHIQTGKFTPQIDGQNAELSFFRVHEGQLIAGVSPISSDEVQDENAGTVRGYIQFYNLDLDLVKQFQLPFAPTALDIDQSGNLFVGGVGKAVKLSRQGEIIAGCQSPNMMGVDLEQLKRDRRQVLLAQRKELQDIWQGYVDGMKEQISEIKEGIDAGKALSEDDSRKLKTLESRRDSFLNAIEEANVITDAEVQTSIEQATRITAMTITPRDLFLVTNARAGSSYEVYRFDHNFEQPQRVLQGLRGCCRQLDIHAVGDNFAVAENTKFNIAVYDRDGEELNRFGEHVRVQKQGFSSCCNPMNVLCCENGDYLTAESGVGKIKRFNARGEIIGYVGEAKIGPGCKSVALGFDPKLDRYFVQHQDSNEICILNRRASLDRATGEKPENKEAGQNE